MRAYNILAIEDSDPFHEDFESFLDSRQYTLTWVKHGMPAIELLRSSGIFYNIIIFDRSVPKHASMEMLKEIQADIELKHIPVILLSSQTYHQELIAGIEAGAYYYLPKPYGKDELLAIVYAAVSRNDDYLKLRNELEKSKGVAQSLSLLQNGTFSFSLRTREEVFGISKLLSYLCPNRSWGFNLLYEMLMNAVEHGNLGFTYNEKTQLLESKTWVEAMNYRMSLEEYRHKQVKLEAILTDTQIVFRIEDEGNGFRWEDYMDFPKGEKMLNPNGRGIPMCHHTSGFKLEYQGKGNIVVASIARSTS